MASVYDIITDDIIALLERGTVPWSRPWNTAEATPRNLASGKPYRGINPWILMSRGFSSPYWLTFKQAADRGGSVQKGEKGTRVVFWKIDQGETDEDKRFILRYYTVFNASQCDGIDVPASETTTIAHNPIETAERIVSGYHGPTIAWNGTGAYYAPAIDHVTMPPRETFTTPEGIYATLFHELAHSTGHASRLNRTLEGRHHNNGTAYGKEELIAEMAATYLCGHAGILPPQIEQSAAYCKSWITTLKGDSRLVIHAASSAQKAADYIIGTTTIESEGE